MIYDENNFPIKYALMPFYKRKGWDNFNYPTYEIAYYLPMPCYLIKESKVYHANDNPEMEYEVVFVTEKRDLSQNQQLPQFNFHGHCNNSDIVTSIYEDYESAKASIELGKLNEDCMIQGMLSLPNEEFLTKTKEKEEEIKSSYEFIEKEILPKYKQKVLKKSFN